MRIFLFLFGKFKYFVILRQYRAAAASAIACFLQQRALMNFFSDEAQLNFEITFIFLTFVSRNKQERI